MSELVAGHASIVAQAMPPAPHEEYSGAVWIAAVDDAALIAGSITFAGLSGYARARLLVRAGPTPRGFVELPIVGGTIDLEAARRAVAALPPVTRPERRISPPISVVLCTYDRPRMLAQALRSLLDLEYPEYEVVVVDNHPASGLTGPVVAAIGDPRLRLVSEPRRGLARARNSGALATRHCYVAFTDDDVVIDRGWLHGIADGFRTGSDVACVTGIVPSGEIASPSQAYFDRRVSWATRCEPELYSLARKRPAEPLFPFQVGRFGTGANFAVRRDTLVALGGFDEALGVGSACGGGEDIDLFVRIVLAGHELAYTPSALVWHKHRRDLESLTRQITDYGTGLGAWMAKLAVNPRTLLMMMRRLRPGLAHYRRITRPALPITERLPDHDMLSRVERRAVLRGPIALLRARLSGARGRPLARSNSARPAVRPEEKR